MPASQGREVFTCTQVPPCGSRHFGVLLQVKVPASPFRCEQVEVLLISPHAHSPVT